MIGRVLAVVCVAAAAFAAPKVKKAPPRWETLPLPPAMPDARETGKVDVGGAQIYYGRYGKPDAPTVILLHGGLGNSDHFAFQMPALVGRFDVLVIDSRGQGRSTMSKAKLSYHAMATDVLAVMDKLAVPRAAMVGWSDGGEIALDLAIHAPERVSKLFVVGANYDANGSKPRGGSRSATFQAYAAKCKADHEKLSAKPKGFDELIDALLPVWRNPAGFTKAELEGIQAPSVIALGGHDEIIVQAQVVEMGKLIPNGRSLIFKDASHFVMWQAPDEFNRALVDFLTAN